MNVACFPTVYTAQSKIKKSPPKKKKNPNRSKFANSSLKKPNESSNYSQLNREDKVKKKLKKSDTEKAKTTFSDLILSHMRRESDPDFILLFFFFPFPPPVLTLLLINQDESDE